MQGVDTTSVFMPSDLAASYGAHHGVPQVELFVGNVDLSCVVPHQEQGVEGVLRTNRLGDNSGVTGLFLLMFCVMAYVVGSSKYFLAYRLKDFFSRKRTYAGNDAEVNRSEVGGTLLLIVISCMSLALMICDRLVCNDACEEVFGTDSLFAAVGISFAAIVLLLLAKVLVYAAVNGVFFRPEANARWMSSFFLLCSVLALILFPLSLIEVYSGVDTSVVTFCLLTTLVLCEMSLFYKLYANFCANNEGFVLIFLYFCNVEILPLLLIGRFCANVL